MEEFYVYMAACHPKFLQLMASEHYRELKKYLIKELFVVTY